MIAPELSLRVDAEPRIPSIDKEDAQSDNTSRTSSTISINSPSGSSHNDEQPAMDSTSPSPGIGTEVSPKKVYESDTPSLQLPTNDDDGISRRATDDDKVKSSTNTTTSMAYSMSITSSTLCGEPLCGTVDNASKSDKADKPTAPSATEKMKHQLIDGSDTYTVAAVSTSSISTLSCYAFNPPEFEDLLRRKKVIWDKKNKQKPGGGEESAIPTGTFIQVHKRETDGKTNLRRRSERRRLTRQSSSRRRTERGRSLVSSRRENGTEPADNGDHRRSQSLNEIRSAPVKDEKTVEQGNPHCPSAGRPPRLPPNTAKSDQDEELQRKLQDANDTIARLQAEVKESQQTQSQLQKDLQSCQKTVSELLRCSAEEVSVVKVEPNICHDLRDELVAAFQLIHEQGEHIKMLESKGEKGGNNTDTVPHLRCKISKLEVNRAYDEFQLRKRISQEAEAFQQTIDHWKRSSEVWKTRFESLWNDWGSRNNSTPANVRPGGEKSMPMSPSQTSTGGAAKHYPVYTIPQKNIISPRTKPPIWNEQRTPKGKRVLGAGLALTMGKMY